MNFRIPNKPFDNYKWRWAEFTPSEGLNNPIRFLGVLRAMYKFQGLPKSTDLIRSDLEKIQIETNQLTGESVTLTRVGGRNLFRNSDRYWKALGLLESNRLLQLTPFGVKVAKGDITQNEFAITVIKSLTLPNRYIESDVTEWEKIDLTLKPLELILKILNSLFIHHGEHEAYITPLELQKIVIPLAGDNGTLIEYTETIFSFRMGQFDISRFPDCAPGANDKRMVREFLLFLSNYGFCQLYKTTTNPNDRFALQKEYISEIEEIISLHHIKNNDTNVEAILHEIRDNPTILNTERQKVLVKVLSRPQQPKFRKAVLKSYDNTCILTGEKIKIVLEACHIIPVEHRGSDDERNGLCLRADLHILYDSKHIRFRPDGLIEYSETLRSSSGYANLPTQVKFPRFVSSQALQWRYDYF